MNPLLAIGAAAATTALSIAGLRRFQLSQVFRPERAVAPLKPDPTEAGLSFDDVVLKGRAGRLHGWWVPANGDDAATILICHGNAGNIGGRVGTTAFFAGLGLNVFIFDYRGYGLSDGTPSERGLYEDALTAWQHLTVERAIPEQRIVLLGRSLGGAVATELALSCRPGAVMIESTFLSIAHMARERFPGLPLWRLSWARFDNAARIAMIDAPLLQVHSVDDEVIPFHHGEALAELRGARGELVEIGGTHSGCYQASGDRYAEPVRAFLRATGHI